MEGEVVEEVVVLWTLPLTEAEVVVGLKVLRKAELVVEEGTSCLEEVEERQHQA